jgi:hypothetical protein
MKNILALCLCLAWSAVSIAQETSAPVTVAVTNPPSAAVKPVLASAQPLSIMKGSGASFILTGTNFDPKAVVNITTSQSLVPVVVVPTSVSATLIKFDLPPALATFAGVLTFTVTNPAVPFPPPCQITAGATWQSVAILNQTSGSFSVQFDSTPSMANEDSVTGLSSGVPTAYTSLAAAIRFNDTGSIDARNGSAYAAATPVPYTPGTKYSFVLTVNMATRTYSATVNGILIGKDFAFRTEQAAIGNLDHVGALAATGSSTVCGLVVAAIATPTPTVHTVSLSWQAPAGETFQVLRSTVSGSGYVQINTLPINARQYTDSNVTNGQTYFYVVNAIDANGNISANSVEAKAVIP